MIWIARTSLALLIVAGGCGYKASPSKGGGQVSEKAAARQPRPSSTDIDVPAGYRIDLVARNLSFPTGIAFGDDGAMYVVESGYSYGEVITRPRIVELDAETGEIKREVATGTHAPWNGIAVHDGSLFVSQGGAIELVGRVARFDLAGGPERVLVDKLPTGDHHTNGPIVVDGWVYFTQGAATNSGVVGVDNASFGWLKRMPTRHDVPCRDITLVGTNFESPNPLTEDDDTVTTGAYLPFGTPSSPGQTIKGTVPCTGAVMRVRPDGSNLELVAWGLRNTFGLAHGIDGIYMTDNGYDTRGSRPVFGAPELLFKLEPGAWYGWPDYVGADPVNAEAYDEAEGETKGFLLARHPGKPPQPKAFLPVHASADGFDVARNHAFGYRGQAFVALFGDMAPSVGKVLAPVGFSVVRVDLATGIYRDFARNHADAPGPASKLGTHGLERPVAVRFDPGGENLYVVDFGVVRMTDKGAAPEPGTGALWRISREVPRATRN